MKQFNKHETTTHITVNRIEDEDGHIYIVDEDGVRYIPDKTNIVVNETSGWKEYDTTQGHCGLCGRLNCSGRCCR